MESIPGSGGRVRWARQCSGWTQAQLAERLGVSRVRVVQWEGSDEGRYSAHRAVELARTLGVTVGWLLTGTGSRRPRRGGGL